jgi:peroxiredoxin
VLGVSADRQEVNDRFRAELDLPFPLVGDPHASIISAYRVKWPLVKIASRVTFIIDRDRRIAAAHKSARDIEGHVALAREHSSGS